MNLNDWVDIFYLHIYFVGLLYFETDALLNDSLSLAKNSRQSRVLDQHTRISNIYPGFSSNSEASA